MEPSLAREQHAASVTCSRAAGQTSALGTELASASDSVAPPPATVVEPKESPICADSVAGARHHPRSSSRTATGGHELGCKGARDDGHRQQLARVERNSAGPAPGQPRHGSDIFHHQDKADYNDDDDDDDDDGAQLKQRRPPSRQRVTSGAADAAVGPLSSARSQARAAGTDAPVVRAADARDHNGNRAAEQQDARRATTTMEQVESLAALRVNKQSPLSAAEANAALALPAAGSEALPATIDVRRLAANDKGRADEEPDQAGRAACRLDARADELQHQRRRQLPWPSGVVAGTTKQQRLLLQQCQEEFLCRRRRSSSSASSGASSAARHRRRRPRPGATSFATGRRHSSGGALKRLFACIDRELHQLDLLAHSLDEPASASCSGASSEKHQHQTQQISNGPERQPAKQRAHSSLAAPANNSINNMDNLMLNNGRGHDDKLLRVGRLGASDGETSSSSGSSVCSSQLSSPLGAADLLALAGQQCTAPGKAHEFEHQSSNPNTTSMNNPNELNHLNKHQQASSVQLRQQMLLADMLFESTSDEDSGADEQQARPSKRLKQSSETSVLMMMQHLTRRRNELKVIDVRLLNMMSSCMNRLDSSSVAPPEQFEPATTAVRPQEGPPVLIEQQQQQQQQQQVAMDLSNKSRASRLHPKKVRLLEAAAHLAETNQPTVDSTQAQAKLAQQQQLSWVARKQQNSLVPLSLVVAPQHVQLQPQQLYQPNSHQILHRELQQQQQQMCTPLSAPVANANAAPAAPAQPQHAASEQLLGCATSSALATPQLLDYFQRHLALSSAQHTHQMDFGFGVLQHLSQAPGADLTLAQQAKALACSGHAQQLVHRQAQQDNDSAFTGTPTIQQQQHHNLKRTSFSTANQLDQLMRHQIHMVQQAQLAPASAQQRAAQANAASDLIMPIVQKMSSFRCHVCHSCFEDRHRLQQHLSIHLDLHPSWFEERTIKETMAQYELRRGDYLCQLCQLRYETTAEFDKHMQLHGEKPHRCELCQQTNNKLVSFRYFRQLLTHLRSHCFLYSCKFAPECKQTANRKDYLKLHILKHHLHNKLPEKQTICYH